MKTRILGISAAVALCCTGALAGTVAKPGITPVEAELMADLHARLLKVGTTIYARVTADWTGTDCALRNGAILEGHVTEVVPRIKPAKGSEVSLAFTKAQCGGKQMGSFDLLLSAMAAPPEHRDLGLMSESLPVLLTGSQNPGGEFVLNSMKASTYVSVDLQTQISEFPVIPNMQMGYVSGIGGLKLSVGTGPEDSTVLISKDHDVALLKHTLMLLIPTQGAFPRTTDNSGAAQPASADSNALASDAGAAAPAQPPVDDIDLCAPPQCSVALPPGSAIDAGNATGSISISQLGYAPRPQKEMSGFDNDEVLAYLGHRELLVAFNPHKLVARHTQGRSGSNVRVIRAALVDTGTNQVTHTVDWELPDDRQYLWQLTEGRVLVHVGSELRVYGEGLKIQNRISLDGPLAFVRVTPDGRFMAVGVIRERHTSELHAQLSQSLNGDPEEDVSIQVLNRSFETIAKSTARSGLMEPTLLNEGQARLQALPHMRFRISMLTWNNQARIVTRFESGCTPELSSIAPDLLFLVSCDKQTQGREYRVLRPDGKVVLKGEPTLNELGHTAEGITDTNAFVVKTVQSGLPATPGAVFRATDLSSEELRVYRATDGKRLFGVRVGSPSPSRDGYALSPDGSQLAVLTRDQISVYAVAGK